MIKLKNKVGSAKLKELIVKDKKSKMVPVDNPYGSRPDVHYSDYMDRRRPVYREDYLPRRMTYQGRRTGRDYIPIHTSHGPGLYRNHSMVHGDSLRVREYDRVYIHHRPAFDWYNNNRYDLIDDVEEVLLPYEYDPLQTYARRTRRMSRCRSATPEIIVVKKKPEPAPYRPPSPQPIIYRPPSPKPIIYRPPSPKPIIYRPPSPKPAPTYSNIVSIKTAEVPIRYSGPQVIYHGKTADPKNYNQDLSAFKSKSFSNAYTNYETKIDRSAYVASVQDYPSSVRTYNNDPDFSRQLVQDLIRLEREGRLNSAGAKTTRQVQFNDGSNPYRDPRYN